MSTSTTQDPHAAASAGETAQRTVRDATFDTLRALGIRTVYSNPGSTEIAFLTGFPDDIEFVLGLHEGAVVAMAAGEAIGSGKPGFVLLHTTAGFGNAVSAIATARESRSPLVIAVGQQDRRHLSLAPFLAGKIEGLAGDYPVSVEMPVRPQDVPGALRRAYHAAVIGRGPAVVIVPQGDFSEPAPEAHETGGPERLVVAHAADENAVDELAAFLGDATSPALVVGAAAATDDGWAGVIALAERLHAPVFQETFGPRAGFPQVHPLFAGHLPADRPRLRETLQPFDAVLSIGAPVFRQYPFTEGPLVHGDTRVAMVSDDPAEVRRSPVDVAVLGDPGATAAALAARLDQAPGEMPAVPHELTPPAPPEPGRPLLAVHVLAGLAARLPEDMVVVEESPSSRHQLTHWLPARTPLGYVSAAMGGLGFAIPGAAGLRRALPDRPVVAILGDGSAMFQAQSYWGLAQYDAGVLLVVLVNDGYKVMDKLAERFGGTGPWPAFGGIDHAAIARAQGCEAITITDHETLERTLDEVVPTLASRTAPLLLAVEIGIDDDFNP